MVEYAKAFAGSNGRGPCHEKAYEQLVAAVGGGKASSARALCWFLHWGSFSGNTINALLKGRLSGAPKAGSNLIFETLFVSYYAICFFLVHLTSTFLRILPRCPPFVNAILGAVLTVVAGSFVVPIGMLGLITAPLRKTTVPLL